MMFNKWGGVAFVLMLAHSAAIAASQSRTEVSLNGSWDISESVGPEEKPKTYTNTVPVPGLVNLAKPAFPDVDMFASWDCLHREGKKFLYKDETRVQGKVPITGIPLQDRNYFWYKKVFKAPGMREVALLRIDKAQFGTAVFLNGKPVGEHLSCWTAETYNLTDAIDWSGENELLVRIGAHPAVLPVNIPGAGTCSSKFKWTPGIYDEVKLIFCDNPVIETIQVAPRLETSEVVVQTKVRNYSSKAKEVVVGHAVRTWKDQQSVTEIAGQPEKLAPLTERTFTQTLSLKEPRLWSPEDPFLYELESRTGGDSQKTRFGMREYRFDNKKGIGYLNGKPYYLRGGNIELWLHAEDPLCGDRPWDRQWVKKLLADIPKSLGWNAFRFSMSPVPQMWLDVADEEGILVQLEPLIWKHRKEWDVNEVKAELARWMRDNWNHPSIFMWDSNNETNWASFVEIVNAVRPLDLSNRRWDNGWSPDASPDDPKELHAYLQQGKGMDYRQIQGRASQSEKQPGGQCRLNNEYDWLWLYPDGAPLTLTNKIYPKAVPNGTAEERREYRWYMTAGLTEYFRASARHMAVMYYEYLGSLLSRPAPGPYHFGVFADVVSLELQPEFKVYMADALKPLGVYIDFWGDGAPTKEQGTIWSPIQAGKDRSFSIVVVNDDTQPAEGTLTLMLKNSQEIEVESKEVRFKVDAAGKSICKVELSIPDFDQLIDNKYTLSAVAAPEGKRHKGTTTSLRKVLVEDPQQPASDLSAQ